MMLWVGGLRLLFLIGILVYLWEVSKRIRPMSVSVGVGDSHPIRLSWVSGPDIPVLFRDGDQIRSLSKGEEVQLKGVVGMGRDVGNTIQVSDPYISAYHARLAPERSGWCLTDLASKNGTLRNNEFIQEPVLIHTGDIVRIGETTFVFKG